MGLYDLIFGIKRWCCLFVHLHIETHLGFAGKTRIAVGAQVQV
jgi:hypothetical protein